MAEERKEDQGWDWRDTVRKDMKAREENVETERPVPCMGGGVKFKKSDKIGCLGFFILPTCTRRPLFGNIK